MSPMSACIRINHSSQPDLHLLFRSASGHVRTPEDCCWSRRRPNTPEEDCSRLSKWRNRNLCHQSNRAAEDAPAVLQHQDARAGHPEDCQRKWHHWTVEGHHAISCEFAQHISALVQLFCSSISDHGSDLTVLQQHGIRMLFSCCCSAAKV